MEIKINGKTLLATLLLSAGLAFGQFVSMVNADQAGGVTIIKEVPEESSSNTPIGTVALWLGSSAPDGWAIMQGQSTVAFPELASQIGGTIPDMRGKFARGAGGKSAPLGQSQSGSVQPLGFSGNALPNHTHNVLVYGTNGKYSSDGQSYNTNIMQGAKSEWTPKITRNDVTAPASAGTPTGTITGTGTETRPDNVSFNYIIKTK